MELKLLNTPSLGGMRVVYESSGLRFNYVNHVKLKIKDLASHCFHCLGVICFYLCDYSLLFDNHQLR